MRLRIDTEGVRFRVAALPRPRMESRNSDIQKTTPPSDGSRPIWVVKLNAFDQGAGASGSMEAIWVEVAGPKPDLVLDELADVQGLTYAPWARVVPPAREKDRPKAEIMRAFRALSVVMAGAAKIRAAS